VLVHATSATVKFDVCVTFHFVIGTEHDVGLSVSPERCEDRINQVKLLHNSTHVMWWNTVVQKKTKFKIRFAKCVLVWTGMNAPRSAPCWHKRTSHECDSQTDGETCIGVARRWKNLAWQHGTSATFNQRSFRRYARRTTIEDHTVATWQVPAVTNLAVAFTSDLVYVVTARYPFDAHCCHMGTAIKHPVPDRVKPSFVIFDIRALW